MGTLAWLNRSSRSGDMTVTLRMTREPGTATAAVVTPKTQTPRSAISARPSPMTARTPMRLNSQPSLCRRWPADGAGKRIADFRIGYARLTQLRDRFAQLALRPVPQIELAVRLRL